MKHDANLDSFLSVQVKKISKNNAARSKIFGRCEVLALGLAPSSRKNTANMPSPERIHLHRNYEVFRPLVEKLQKNSEISTRFGATCLVRFYGGFEKSSALADH